MKQLITIVFFMALASCQQVASVKPAPTRHVVNSLWKEVSMDTVNAQGKSIVNRSSAVNLDANVAAYNADHISDQWFIIDGDIPGIDQAPPVNVWIVDKVTHVPMQYDDGNGTGTMIPFSFLNYPRKDFVENYLAWVQYAQSTGGDMYVDVIPPAPTPPTSDQIYAKYSIYIVNNIGAIKYEYHCDTVPDGFQPMTPDQYFDLMLRTANLSCQTDGVGQPDSPWQVISGRVYTAP